VDDVGHKERVQAQFGRSAAAYVTSAVHAEGDDLEQLVAWAEGGADKVALDVATGGGHTALALAPHYGRVVASDLTEEMLASATSFIRGRGLANVEFRRADAEDLPIAAATLDLVSSRIAPHHFPNVARFVAEVDRVLRPGGIVLLEDSIVPEDLTLAAWLNRLEALRDPTHVRSLRLGEWRSLLTGAGLAIEAERIFPKAHPLTEWLERARTSDANRAAIRTLIRDAPPLGLAQFVIAFDPVGNPISYIDEKVVLKARKDPEQRH
jgi:SAM-dependent methyltransferase